MRHRSDTGHSQSDNGVDFLGRLLFGNSPAPGILNGHGRERLLPQFVGRVDFEIEPGQKIEKGLTHQRAVGLRLSKLADRNAGGL